MPFGRFPNLTAGSAFKSLWLCGQTTAMVLSCENGVASCYLFEIVAKIAGAPALLSAHFASPEAYVHRGANQANEPQARVLLID